MKPATEMIEGPEAFTRFQNAMQKIVSTPHSVIQKRIEEHKTESDAKPNKRGPKRKAK